MDIDTITFKSYKNLLIYNTVLGYEMKNKDLICNAVMMTSKNSEFFKLWLEGYENDLNQMVGEKHLYFTWKNKQKIS